MMRPIRRKYWWGAALPLTLLVLLVGFSVRGADKPNPNEIDIVIITKGIPGARATMSARIHAPVDAVWQALIDFNRQAKKYPRLEHSFCIQAAHAEEAEKDGLRNGATVDRRYGKDACDPYASRKPGQKWSLQIFQEFDYPFPLTDRWIIADFAADERSARQRSYALSGRLRYGHQKIYEIDFRLKPHPQNPQETFLEFIAWIDPGGIIMDWMLREATEYVAPKYMELLESEAKKRFNSQGGD